MVLIVPPHEDADYDTAVTKAAPLHFGRLSTPLNLGRLRLSCYIIIMDASSSSSSPSPSSSSWSNSLTTQSVMEAVADAVEVCPALATSYATR